MRFLELTTNGIAASERYDAWRERAWPSLARMMRTSRPPGEFYSHSRLFRLGRVIFNDTRMAGQSYERTSSLIRSDGFNGISIAVNLAGRFHGETAAGSYRGGPGSVLFGDLSAPFRQSSTNARCVTLVFDRETIEELVPRFDGLHGLVLSGLDAAPLVHQVSSLVDDLSGLEEGLGESTGEAVIGTFLSVLGSTGAVSLSEEAHLARLRAEVRWIIEQRYREPDLDITRIAMLARVSRATLYRAFADLEGISASVTRLRLERAAEALRDGTDRRQIGEIALAVGFDQPCTFNRAFRRRFGCTPRDWRADRSALTFSLR
ncbi:AraC family transcriptional regulator [Aureimonas ureilytica]|uniref:AraC family transcriptional regulator n=1 Tax=Aureimonas ureilytica TaxID=401562 RepID=UPI003CFA6950